MVQWWQFPIGICLMFPDGMGLWLRSRTDGCSMAWVTAFPLAATKAMSGQMSNFSTTMAADMRLTQRDTETEAHSHTDSVIVHPKAK